jgi:hypothetical protein
MSLPLRGDRHGQSFVTISRQEILHTHVAFAIFAAFCSKTSVSNFCTTRPIETALQKDLRQNLLDDLAAKVCQADVEAFEAVDEAMVIEAE